MGRPFHKPRRKVASTEDEEKNVYSQDQFGPDPRLTMANSDAFVKTTLTPIDRNTFTMVHDLDLFGLLENNPGVRYLKIRDIIRVTQHGIVSTQFVRRRVQHPPNGQRNRPAINLD